MAIFLTACGQGGEGESADSALKDTAAEIVKKSPLSGFLPPENLQEKLNEAPSERPNSELAKAIEASPFGALLPPADIFAELNKAPSPESEERTKAQREFLEKFWSGEKSADPATNRSIEELRSFLKIPDSQNSKNSKKSESFDNQGDFDREF